LKKHNPRQLELALGGCMYVAATTNGDSLGDRLLPADTPYFPQLGAADDPTWDPWDSCVGRWHY